MKRTFSPAWFMVGIILLFALMLATWTPFPAAAVSSGYDLSWNVIAGGGATNLSGGAYTLGSTIGQYEAGTASQGAYKLNGGFWVDLAGFNVFLPIILR